MNIDPSEICEFDDDVFEVPSAIADKLTPFQLRLMIERTFRRPCLISGDGTDYSNGFTVFLKIDHQSFSITAFACESAEHADWFRSQMAIALSRLIETETKDRQ